MSKQIDWATIKVVGDASEYEVDLENGCYTDGTEIPEEEFDNIIAEHYDRLMAMLWDDAVAAAESAYEGDR